MAAMTTRTGCRSLSRMKRSVMRFVPLTFTPELLICMPKPATKNCWKPLTAIWNNLVEKKLYITGGCGALYDGASPDGSKDQSSITRVHQAFGRNYQLPNTTAHNETCANIGNVLWNWRMFLASGEAKHIDVLELALYNSVLSGVSLSGTDFIYTNPLRQSKVAPVKLRWSGGRVPFVTSFCCPPNVARTIAEVNGYAYGKSDNAIWVNLYGSSTLDTKLANGSHVRLEQHTDYPWDGKSSNHHRRMSRRADGAAAADSRLGEVSDARSRWRACRCRTAPRHICHAPTHLAIRNRDRAEPADACATDRVTSVG